MARPLISAQILIIIICAEVFLTDKEKQNQSLTNLTAMKFHVILLIKQRRRRLSQALTVSLGAEYIMEGSTLILYGQINPTSLRVSLPPSLSTPPFIILIIGPEERGEGKERREALYTSAGQQDMRDA